MKEKIINLMKEHNESIDKFVNEELPVLLGYEKGVTEVPMNDWFKAQQLIRQQNFYEKALKLCLLAKENGIECKMDMQTDKLVY